VITSLVVAGGLAVAIVLGTESAAPKPLTGSLGNFNFGDFH
jgi:hypothetical protein